MLKEKKDLIKFKPDTYVFGKKEFQELKV